MFDKISNLKTQLESAQAMIKTQGRAALSEAFKELFQQFPDMPEFMWKHTRPYCDGDSTYFTVMGFSPQYSIEQLAELLDDSEIDEDGRDEVLRDGLEWSLKDAKKPEAVALSKAMQALKAAATDDVLELLFGDHKKITVTRDGKIQTEDYYEDY